MRDEQSKKLEIIKRDVLDLPSSSLVDYRKENGYFPVVGEGSPNAEIMFVGEAPGKKEAETGKPFCGSAGKILDELLSSVSIKRENVYITSIVKDRPPKNRDPLPDEIALYAPFLDRQIEIIKPKVIATLGRFAMQYIMSRYWLEKELSTIGDLHGKVFETDIDGVKVRVVPLYHPAASIYNQHLKSTLLEDFNVLKNFAK